ncbi:MAG TPA: Ig-like domain-containing protein, partial [Vicinamibacterales bacterium]
MFRRLLLLVLCALPSSVCLAQAPAAIRIVSAGPAGDVSKIEEANEIRVVFSEAMVALGQVPPNLKPAFFHIAPSVAGTFRWSGTTILIFTPAKRLALATKYDVSIDAGTPAVSGHTLQERYTFSFTTPAVHLLSITWYRPNGRFDAAPVILLRFNQPVKPSDVVGHTAAAFEAHDFVAPVLPASAVSRLRAIDLRAEQAFADKVTRASQAAAATASVSLKLTGDWDRKQFPPSPDLVVLQATSPVPPDSWVRVETDGRIPSPAGRAVALKSETY